MALNHYLDQCWLLISEVLWQSYISASPTILYNEFGKLTFKMIATSPQGQGIHGCDVLHCRSEEESSWDDVISLPTPADTNHTQVTGLHPHMGYQVIVKAKNFVGFSPQSEPSDMVKTMSDGKGGHGLERKYSTSHMITVTTITLGPLLD